MSKATFEISELTIGRGGRVLSSDGQTMCSVLESLQKSDFSQSDDIVWSGDDFM